jgi:hypothetical protein
MSASGREVLARIAGAVATEALVAVICLQTADQFPLASVATLSRSTTRQSIFGTRKT